MKRITLLLIGMTLLSAMLPLNGHAAIKNIYGPYLQNVSDKEATIVWEASESSIGWVELAPDDGTNFYSYERPKYFDCTNGVKNAAKLHSVKIMGLKPGTTYRYRIYSKQVLSHQGTRVNYDASVAANDVFTKQPLQFKTLDPNKGETSFLIMNDIHSRVELIPTLLDQAKYKDRDLIFFNGDMVSIINKKEDFFDGFMSKSIELFAQEKAAYYCRGNHETRGEFATHFQDYFNPRIPHLYFTVRQGPVCFVILDTGEDKPDSDIEYSGIVDYDGYRTEQAEWLKTVKDMTEFKTAKYKIVICHMPTTLNKDEWHGNVDCLEKFTPQLNEMGIDLMICGHTHTDSYNEPNDRIKYPVMVNSKNGVVTANADGNELKIKVIHDDGKVVTEKTYKPGR